MYRPVSDEVLECVIKLYDVLKSWLVKEGHEESRNQDSKAKSQDSKQQDTKNQDSKEQGTKSQDSKEQDTKSLQQDTKSQDSTKVQDQSKEQQDMSLCLFSQCLTCVLGMAGGGERVGVALPLDDVLEVLR